MRQQKEDRERRQVSQQGELPFAQARNVFEQQERKGRSEVTQHEGDGMRAPCLRRFLQQNPQGQDHKNRAGVGNLPLEVAAFNGVRLHGDGSELLFQTKRAPER